MAKCYKVHQEIITRTENASDKRKILSLQKVKNISFLKVQFGLFPHEIQETHHLLLMCISVNYLMLCSFRNVEKLRMPYKKLHILEDSEHTNGVKFSSAGKARLENWEPLTKACS